MVDTPPHGCLINISAINLTSTLVTFTLVITHTRVGFFKLDSKNVKCQIIATCSSHNFESFIICECLEHFSMVYTRSGSRGNTQHTLVNYCSDENMHTDNQQFQLDCHHSKRIEFHKSNVDKVSAIIICSWNAMAGKSKTHKQAKDNA